MADREKLIELFRAVAHENCFGSICNLSDYLLDNGVTVLPCKPGDTVYATHWFAGFAGERWERQKYPLSKGVQYISIQKNGDVLLHFKDGAVLARYFGEYIFATREEAQAAMKAGEVGSHDLQ